MQSLVNREIFLWLNMLEGQYMCLNIVLKLKQAFHHNQINFSMNN